MARAATAGLPGGTATQTAAGFGRHGYFHDERMVDLSVNSAVRVYFFLPETRARQLLRSVQEFHPGIVFQICPAEVGTTVESSLM
ncbi:MAG: DUF190 domain-containing protein [Proteobacteria bacterium]|nr:DUF190 domain-containing protein [Pseudomonadota bacterium]